MTLTTSERLTVNGHDMKTLARNVATLAATLRVPAKRLQNASVAGRHGAIFVPRKKYDQNVLTWPVWIVGTDADGNVPVGSTDRREFFKNLDELLRVMRGDEAGELEIKHYLPDGTVRVGKGEVTNTIDFVTSGRSPVGQVVFEITMADPFWREETTFEKVIPLGTSWLVNTDFEIPELFGGNAPIIDAELEIWSPSNNMVIRSGTRQDVSFTVDGNGYTDIEALQVLSGRHRIYKKAFSRSIDRVNRHRNPSMEANITGYANISGGVGGTITRIATDYKPVGGVAYGQSVATGSGLFHIRLHPDTTAEFTGMGYVPGLQYTIAAHFRLKSVSPSASTNVVLRILFYQDATFISSVDSTTLSLTRATNDLTDTAAWKRLAMVVTVPSNCNRIDLSFFTGSNIVLNDTINWDGVTVEEGDTTALPYIDGSSPASAWDGTIFNSRSFRYATQRQNLHTNPTAGLDASGYSNNGGVGGTPSRQTTGVGIDGKNHFVRVAATATGAVSVYQMQLGDVEFHKSYLRGAEYTWSVYVRYDGAAVSRDAQLHVQFYQSSTLLSTISSSIVAVPRATSLGTVSFWNRLTLTGTVPATCTRVGFYVTFTGAVSGDAFHFDCGKVEPGAVATSYFDGDTVTAPGTYWSAGAHASDSYQGILLDPNPWGEIGNFQYIGHSGDSHYLYLAPGLDGKYKIRVGGSSAGSTPETKLILRSSRRFLTG